MFINPFTGIVERLKFFETLKVPDTRLGHLCYLDFGRFIVEFDIQNLHFTPCIDAVVIDQRRDLDVFVEDVFPVDLRVLVFFLVFDGVDAVAGSLFFSASNASFAASSSAWVSSNVS